MKNRSLVTGAAGFIGSHVCAELISRGHEVTALDDLSGGFPENVPAECRFVQGSINDSSAIQRLFAENTFDYIFHLAAYAAEGLSHFIKHFNYSNNLLGSVNLINAAVNSGTVKCFVFTSSIAVYGKNQLPMSEDMAPMPEDPYGIAKYAVELDLRESHEIFGLNSLVFRPHNVYGERQNLGDRYRNVIGIFMNQMMQGKELTIFGDGKQTRAFSYISDIAPIIAASVDRPEAYNQVFNIGADNHYSILDLVHAVADAMNIEPKIKFLDARNEVVHAYCSHEKVKRYFGDLVKNVSLKEGLSQMAGWAKRAGVRSGQAFDSIEVAKNMPPSWRAFIKNA